MITTPLQFSPRVENTLNALPETERMAITEALTGEFAYGQETLPMLQGYQKIVYVMIRDYYRRDNGL